MGLRNHSGRSSPKLSHPPKVQKASGPAAKKIFSADPKQAENDNIPRKMRPAAHDAKQTAIAKRARNTVKKLSNQVI